MSYTVTIAENREGILVARDADGDWRTKGYVADWKQLAPRLVALHLFHECELGNVERNTDGTITAEIME